MIKVILFDADGVVINKKYLFSQKFAQEFSVPMEEISPFFKNDFIPCITGHEDLKQILPKYLTQWKWQGSVEELMDYWMTAEHFIDQQLVEKIEILRSQGIVCALASNQEKYRAQYISEQMGFAKIFDKLYFSYNLGHAKPEKEFFEKIYLDLSGTDKSHFLFWDDDSQNVQAAKDFGFNSELYTNFEDYLQKQNNYKL